MSDMDKVRQLRENIESVLFGKEEAVRMVLVGLLGGGHVLLEDVPGVGKTILAQALSHSIDCPFARIQLTPDLLPSDILGVSVYDSRTGEFAFKKGPIFANILLADEINRTTPRTQSALLEAMSESQVTADGKTYPLGPPFMVLATQNPYEFEGTYFLPENQLDRFLLRTRIGYPDKTTEAEILRLDPARTRLGQLKPVMNGEEVVGMQQRVLDVRMEKELIDYILDIAEATRRSEDLSVGLSPRGSLALMQAARASALLDEREFVVPDDVKDMAPSVCSHRLLCKSQTHDGSAAASEAVFRQILDTIPVPR